MDILAIKRGMGLDELLTNSSPPELYSALQSPVMDKVEQQLNFRVPGGLTELIDMYTATTDSGRKYELADAIEDALLQMKEQVDAVIQSDLDAQAKLREEQATVDLTNQIIPTADTSPDFLNLVATDVFKEILATGPDTPK